MYDVNDILTRLRNGASAEDIANEVADAINLANRTYQEEEKAKAAEAKRKAEEEARIAKEAACRRASQVGNLQDILDSAVEWLADYVGVEATDDDYIDAEELLESVDKMKRIFDFFPSDFHSVFTTSETKNGKTTTKTIKNDNGKVTSTSDTTDAIISDFLRELGL